MTAQEKVQRDCMIRVHPVADKPETIRVSFVPRGLQHERQPGGVPNQVPEFTALVHVRHGKPVVEWENPPSHKRQDLEQEAANRLVLRMEWLRRLSALVDSVQGWAKELGWSTRRIEKEMTDSEIGDYRAPALLLQKETTRVLLEPVGRSAPGTEGVVDLYRLPAYEDIASLYFYDDRWNLHYLLPATSAVAEMRQAESGPLSKASLREVLETMKQNAQ